MPSEIKSDKPAPTADDANKQIPAAEPKPDPAPTPEELEAQANEFAEAAFGNPRSRVEKPAPAAEPEPEKLKEEKPPKEEAKPATEEKPKRKYTPGKTVEEIEAIARRVAAEEREEENEPAPAETKPAPADEEFDAHLTEEDRDQLEVLAEMEASHPAKYKGIGKQARNFWKAEADYQAKWQEKHPDESYNPDAPEHAAFYRKNEPNYSPQDFKLASRAIIEKGAAERAREEVRKEYEPKFQAIEAERALRDAQPKIAESVGTAVEDLFKSVPEFAPLVEAGALSEEAVKQMEDINPAIHDHLTREAEMVVGVVNELEHLTHLPKHHQFDPTKPQRLSSGHTIYPHAIIQEHWHDLEKAVSSAPKEKRMDGGRDFLTNAERGARIQAIRQSNATPEVKKQKLQALADSYWSISPEHIRNRIISQSKARIAAAHTKFSKFSKTPAAPSNGQPTQTPTAADTQKPSAKASLPKGTSTATVSDTADNSSRLGGAHQNSEEEFAKLAF